MMASGSPSAAGSAPLLRRGLISCLHSPRCRTNDEHDAPLLSGRDLHQAITMLILGFYKEAFDRLPPKSDAMTDLLHLLNTGGLCLGLLDPASNIILNTLSLLPYRSSSAPPAAKKSKTQAWADFHKPNDVDYTWYMAADSSCRSLVHFLVAYFGGCLTEEQAFRYLYWAGADLPLAVMLVQHDLYQQPQALDPDSPRTQAALKSAAKRAGHPEPDTLVQLMAIQLYTDGFAILKKQFVEEGDVTSLSSKDFRAIHRLLHRPYDYDGLTDNAAAERTTTSVDVSTDGSAITTTTTTTTVRRVAHHITSLRHIDNMAAKLTSCLTKAYAQKHTLKTPCGGDACDYLHSLKMYLQGMIHDFYVTALTLLPTPVGSLMRSILMAGHCYGCMDPVSNIIVNSIWYNKRGCPLPESDRVKIELYTDILDPLCLLRTVLHSLKGLTKLVAFADPQFSTAARALENLCSAKCDIINLLSSSSWTESFEKKNPFHEAGMAAGHPLPLQLGELHQELLLMPVERGKLLSLMTEARTSGTVLPINDIASILDMVLSSSPIAQTPVLVHAPKTCVEALSKVSCNRLDYEKQKSWFRSKLEQLLKEYASKHVWEPKYTLGFICGVEESRAGHYPFLDTCYHINFMATCGLRLQKTLFYAEFWFADKQKPKFCCPIPFPYAGRCYNGVHMARRIVYPDREEYIERDVRTGSVDGMLEIDLVYFISSEPTKDVDSEEEE